MWPMSEIDLAQQGKESFFLLLSHVQLLDQNKQHIPPSWSLRMSFILMLGNITQTLDLNYVLQAFKGQ